MHKAEVSASQVGLASKTLGRLALAGVERLCRDLQVDPADRKVCHV